MYEDARQCAVFGYEHVRTVLSATSERPMSINELSDTCEASLPMIDRCIEHMIACTLVTEDYEINRDDSLHKICETVFNRMSICFIAGEFDVDIETTDREVAPDQFTRMWEDTHGGK